MERSSVFSAEPPRRRYKRIESPRRTRFVDLAPYDTPQEPNVPNVVFLNYYYGLFSDVLEIDEQAVLGFMKSSAIKGTLRLRDKNPAYYRFGDQINNGLVNLIHHEGETIIEISGQQISQNQKPGKKGDSNEEMFARRFNKAFGSALIDLLVEKKLMGAGEPSSLWIKKVLGTFLTPFLTFKTLEYLLGPEDLGWVRDAVAAYASWPLMVNRLNRRGGPLRSLEQSYETFMPPIEIDRMIRGVAYLKGKGRNLVRLAPQGSK